MGMVGRGALVLGGLTADRKAGHTLRQLHRNGNIDQVSEYYLNPLTFAWNSCTSEWLFQLAVYSFLYFHIL